MKFSASNFFWTQIEFDFLYFIIITNAFVNIERKTTSFSRFTCRFFDKGLVKLFDFNVVQTIRKIRNFTVGFIEADEVKFGKCFYFFSNSRFS